MRKILLFIVLSFLFTKFYGQITTSVNPTIAQMQAALQGNGVVVTGLTLTCPTGAYALFSNGAAALGGANLNSGILLTTGTASNVAGPSPNTTSNNLSYNSSAPGSTLGNSLASGTTYDGCYINFLITPSCNTLSINYVFASEEYPEYVGTSFNDVFGFIISGPNPSGPAYSNSNIALIPGTTTPVSINNVNATTNPAYYVSAPPGLEYDGKTTILSASAAVVPCSTYTMTIGVWDDGDGSFDSAVFLDVNGLSCLNSPTITATPSPSTICGPQTVTLTAAGGIASGTYTWSAPPSGGLTATTGTVVTANPTASTTYTLLYSDINTCPGVPLTKTTVVTITPPPALPVSQSPSGSICSGQSVTLTANGSSGTYSWSPGASLSTTTNSVTVSSPTVTTTYSVTNTVGACVSNSVITVTVSPPSSITITPSLSTICVGQSQALSASGTGPFTWTASTGANPASAANVTVTPSSTTTYTVLSGTGTCTATAVATVSIGTIPTINITPSNTTICLGASVGLSSTGAGPFTWTASTGANPASAANVTVSPSSNTTYTVLSGTGACTAQAVATVSIAPTLSINITPSSTVICLGESVGLSSTGAGPFTWTASTGANPPSLANVTVTPGSTTTYTVLSGTGACTAQAVATVSIAPALTINITPSNTTICLGASTSLSSTGSGPFTWTASTGANPPSAGTVTVTPAATTTYTVLSGTGACTAQAVATVSIAPTLSINITPSNTTICLGENVSLTTNGTGPYNWTASTGSNPPSAGTVTITPGATTTYTVLSGTGACTAQAVATVSISPSLSVNITPSGTIVCNGQSVGLTASGNAGPFSWTASTGTPPGPSGNVTVTPTTTTTYTVLAGTGACTAQAVATVSISPTLTITISPSSPSVCLGFGSTLTAGGATNYTWSPGFSTGSTLSVTPISTSNYTVVGSNGICVNSATTTVSVISLTTNVTSSSTYYCFGVAPVSLAGSGATNYSWSPATDLSSAMGAVVTATPSATTIYTVTGNTSGCISTKTITITVPVLSTITATSSNSVICIGGSSTLTASGASTYTWAPGSMTNDTVSVSPTTTTNYTVIGKTVNGCFAVPAVVTVTVLPVINSALVAGSPSVCLTNTTTISAVASTGLSYTWQPVTAIQGATNTSSVIALPPTTATVIYTVTISNGICAATNTIQLLVRTPPIGNFKTLNNDTICTGGCVTFSSTTTGSSPITHKWYYQSGIGTSSVGVTPEACYPSAGNFSVTLIVSNNCGIDTAVKANYITVFDFPILIVNGDTTINIGEHAEVYASGSLNYSWSPNINGSIVCPTCSNTIVQPTLTTQYIVVASNSKYCKVQDTVTVIVDVNCGDFFIPNVFSPNGDGLNDMINVHGRCISTFNLQIFSRWGEKVFETSSMSDGWDGTFRGQKMDTGVFVYKADGVSIDGQSFKLKGNITLIR
ncbi:MAG: gliding motility-associated C-terminal domain-containing protein [Burkholderiales bacterium]|nr:gliding motility-associated C-terminal domain-containing protein [Bacteroidia bacterium]